MVEAPAISTHDLAKRYGGVTALAGLTMTVPRGEVFGFLGPNGAGKTTSVKLLLGLARPSGGEGRVLGAPLGDRESRRRIGYLPELFRYQEWLSAREVLALHAALLDLPRGERGAAIGEALTLVGLAARGDDRVGTFSKGMQQRLGLGVALLGRPELVLLDEPTSALDPVGRHDVREIIRHLRARGVAVFLNSHLLGEVEQVCDRVAIVDHGRVVATGSLDELLGGTQEVRLRVTGLDAAAMGVARRLRRAGARGSLAGGARAGTGAGAGAGGRAGGAGRQDLRGGAAAPVAGGAFPATAGGGLDGDADRGAAGDPRGGPTPAAAGAGGAQPVGDRADRLGVRAAAGYHEQRGAAERVGGADVGVAAADPGDVHVRGGDRAERDLRGGAVDRGEVESGIALAMLSRPLRRRDVVLGKWIGCATLLIGYTAAVCALEFWVAGRATGYAPPRPLLAVAYLAGEGLVLLTVALALSTRLAGMTGGIVSTVLFFVAWMTGVIGGIGIALGNPGVAHVGTISRLILPSDGLWRGAIYALEPAALLSEARALPRLAGDPFLVDAAPPGAYPLWAACWVLVVLGLAVYSFGRREL